MSRTIYDLKMTAQLTQAQVEALTQGQAPGDAPPRLDGVSLWTYGRKPLEFNVTLAGRRFPTIKFEERSPGKFTVAVAPEDGASIDYTQAKVFTMDEPLEHLAAAFPQNRDMRQFVNCLVNSN